MYAGEDSSLQEAIALSLKRDSKLAESFERDATSPQADVDAEVHFLIFTKTFAKLISHRY